MVKKIGNLILKIIFFIIVFQTTFLPISNVEASNFIDDIISQGDTFLQEGKNNQNGTLNQEQLKDSVNQVYTILLGIGIALSVIIAVVLGIKFMIGSVEEQAKVKETLLPYGLGCIVVFGAFAIWKVVIELGGSIF